jgi:hypothetical protein
MTPLIAKSLEQVRGPWSRLYKVLTAGFSNKQITLEGLVAGDCVRGALIEVKTLVTGPTAAPTAQVKLGSVVITPTVAVKTANYAVTDNTIVGATTATGATNLVLDLQLGGGDGAAATAGEIWVWVHLNTAADRNVLA